MKSKNRRAPQPNKNAVPADQSGNVDTNIEPNAPKGISRRGVIGLAAAGVGVLAVGGFGGYDTLRDPFTGIGKGRPLSD